MNRWALTTLVLVFAAGQVCADDKANPTGTWTWSMGMGGGGGQARTATLKLKLDGGKLTGAMMGRNNQETGACVRLATGCPRQPPCRPTPHSRQ